MGTHYNSMNRRSGEPKENLRRARDDRDPVELVDYLWLARCGVAKARIAADGSIKGVRLGDDGSLVEICIRSRQNGSAAAAASRFVALYPVRVSAACSMRNTRDWSGISPSGISGGFLAGELLRSP